MIHLVTASDYRTYRRELDAMHRLRYRVFKERLGWTVATAQGRERDRYDDLNPLYLLAIDEAGAVVGAWRFLFTTGPYMLRDTFPQLLEGRPPPNDIGIWEGSRFAVEQSQVKGGSLASIGVVAADMLCAVVETCLAAGVRQLITVYDRRMARLLHRMGCPPQRQSPACQVGQGVAMAGYFDMSVEVLESIRQAAHGPAKRPSRQPLPRPSHRMANHGVSYVGRHAQLHRFPARRERGTTRPAPATDLSRGGSA